MPKTLGRVLHYRRKTGKGGIARAGLPACGPALRGSPTLRSEGTSLALGGTQLQKRRLNWTRISVVSIVALVACYSGVRSAADVSVTFSFKGQQSDAYIIGADGAGNG